MRQVCIKVPKRFGEPIRRILMDLDIFEDGLKIGSDEEYLYLPLKRNPGQEEIEPLPEVAHLCEFDFKEQEKRITLDDILGFSPGYEMVGDIALIEADDPNAEAIADAILKVHPNINTVLGALTPVEGEYRTRQFKVIRGEDKKQTIHKEHQCRYFIDLERAYFTPRLSTERARILDQIKPGDVVLDMFAGVGPYSILIAKRSEASRVIAIDKNPDAVELLRKNMALNKAKNIEAIEGDANEEARRFEGMADHVIMNLPHNAYEFLDSAVTATKPGGIVHYYAMTHEDDLFDSSIKLIEEAASRAGRSIEVVEKRSVRSYAPHQYNICIDVRVN